MGDVRATQPGASGAFAQFFVVLLQPLVLSLLAALVLPDIGAETYADLRANYFAQSRWFFSLLVLLLVVSLVKDLVLSGSLPNPLNVGAHVLFIVTSIVGAITKRERVHPVLAPIGIVLMVAYIAVLSRACRRRRRLSRRDAAPALRAGAYRGRARAATPA